MKQTVILILLVCAALLSACAPGSAEGGEPGQATSQRNTQTETEPAEERDTAGDPAVTEPARQTDSAADEPKVTLPKDRF